MEMVIKYWKGEEGYETIYTDNAFCTYEYGDGEFYISNFYVEDRTNGKSYAFFNTVKEKAIALGATRLTANIHMNEANADSYTRKVMTQLKHGFKILKVDTDRITVIYELR